MTKLCLAMALFFTTTSPVWLHSLEAAKETAKKEHKLILLNFSGSDWCIPCIRLHDEIFQSESFSVYANNSLILVNADFPRKNKNKLSKEQQKINDDLAERYNPQGSFPYTLLLDENGNKLKVWDGFYKNGPENFIHEINEVPQTN